MAARKPSQKRKPVKAASPKRTQDKAGWSAFTAATPKRPLGSQFFPLASPGVVPGTRWWRENRAELVRHYRYWVFIGIRAIANKVAEMRPNVSIVREAEASRKDFRFLKRYFRNKALTNLSDTEDLEPVGRAHPLRMLLDNPNNPDTAFSFFYELTMFAFLTGTIYLWMVRDKAGIVRKLWVVPSHWVWPVPAMDDQIIGGYEIRPVEGMSSVFFIPTEDMIFVPFKSPLTKFDGHSPVAAGGRWIDTAESIDQARNETFRHGVYPSGAVELSPDLADPTDEQISRLEQRIFLKFSGSENHRKPIILGPGMKLVPFSWAPVEMDFVQSTEQLRDMVLALLGVPKAVAGIADDYNYASLYATQAGFCTFTVNPFLSLLGQVLTEKLAHEEFDPKLRVWWNDCSPPDPQMVLQQETLDVAAGAITPNELRQRRGLPPFEHGGDDPILPAGMVPVPFGTGQDYEDVSGLDLKLPGEEKPSKEPVNA